MITKEDIQNLELVPADITDRFLNYTDNSGNIFFMFDNEDRSLLITNNYAQILYFGKPDTKEALDRIISNLIH